KRMANAKMPTPDTEGCSVEADGASPSGKITQLLVRHKTSGTSNRYRRLVGLSVAVPSLVLAPFSVVSPSVEPDSPSPLPGHPSGKCVALTFHVPTSGNLSTRSDPLVLVWPVSSTPAGDVSASSTPSMGNPSSSMMVMPMNGTGGCLTAGRRLASSNLEIASPSARTPSTREAPEAVVL